MAFFIAKGVILIGIFVILFIVLSSFKEDSSDKEDNENDNWEEF